MSRARPVSFALAVLCHCDRSARHSFRASVCPPRGVRRCVAMTSAASSSSACATPPGKNCLIWREPVFGDKCQVQRTPRGTASSARVGFPVVGTYNIGAAQPGAFSSSKQKMAFGVKLKGDMGDMIGGCDVICLQEVNEQWAVFIASILPKGPFKSHI